MKRKIIFFILVIFVICLISGIINQFRIVERKYQIKSNKVNDNYTFALVTDYHSETKSDDQIISIIEQNNSDYILLGGDILDSSDIKPTLEFASRLQDISQVIYARGNHENDYQNYNQFKAEMEKLGAIVVDSTNYQTEDLNFIGIEDFSGANLTESEQFSSIYIPYIENYKQFVNEDKFNVLLAHRPNFLDTYANLGVDLVVSGHAHGGQWQLPFSSIGLIAPDEGFFATNVEGIKIQNDTTQIISTGTSNPYSPLIPRIFNPREVVIIEIVKG